MSTPHINYLASSSGANMSVSSNGAPMRLGGTGGGGGALQPKANFLSPSLVSNGSSVMTGINSNAPMSVSTSTEKAMRKQDEDDAAFLFSAVNTALHHPPSATGAQRVGASVGTEYSHFSINKNLGATAFAEGDPEISIKPKVGQPSQGQGRADLGQSGNAAHGNNFIANVGSLKRFMESPCSPFLTGTAS